MRSGHVEVDDPIDASVHEAARVAPTLCRVDPHSGENCCWYHLTWQYLRALRVVTAPAHHRAFYLERLGAWAAAGECTRVLVSGSADYAMPSLVIAACRAAGSPLALAVIDICETPLHLSRWYAERAGVSLPRTRRLDALDLDEVALYDVICTHSFLGYFDAAARPALLTRWHAALRPGGRLMFIHRIRAPDAPPVIGFSDTEAARLEAQAMAAFAERGDGLGVDRERLRELVQAYTSRTRIHAVRSSAEITGPLEASGFSVEWLDSQVVPGAGAGASSGPTTPGGARYAHVVARRD